MATRTSRFSPLRALPWGAFLSTALLGCQPALPEGLVGHGEGDGPAREPEVVLEPAAAFDAAPPVLRLRVAPAEDAEADVSRLLFVSGHVGAGHLRQVENGDLSQALMDRILPAIAWSLEDGSAVLAPTLALDSGAIYGVLSGSPPLAADLRVAPEDVVPLLRRTWPPADAPAGTFAIFCGDAGLPEPPAHVTLGPGELDAVARIGVFESLGERCLRLDLAALPASGGASSPDSASAGGGSTAGDGSGGDAPSGGDTAAPEVAVPPPILAFAGGTTVRLEPTPIAAVAPPDVPPPVAALDCVAPDIPFGPGCARVADDRLFIAGPEAALLWVVRSTAAGEVVRVTRTGEPWVVHGFSPGSADAITLVALDAFGRAYPANLAVFTAPPMPHIVLSEVLANPLGAEPDQEWVELYNDGLAAADLGGYTLADLGGVTALPPAVLAPGAYALVVNESFLEDDEIDPVPAPGTALLRVPKLGKDGLKNDGEPLKLLDAGGQVVSRFPPSPKPKAGQSVARVSPSAPDGVATSFALATPTPGAGNGDGDGDGDGNGP